MIAQTIAHYRIQAKIGAGGMGEVYRATDTRLSRDVALKILPEVFADDATRMARFEREAQILASLNHPNIAAIYGLEESNGIRALAMELVEGQTLAERIHPGAVPIDEALPIAKQICDALEYAHERGIIHRDLKPSNIKINADGTVKVLDFGLAKALEGDATSADISTSPTLSQIATQAGILLGTAAYMAPEQARGKRVDRRADIWAFGVVLYEMLAGKPLFSGETTSDLLADVIKSEPNWSQLPGSLPRRIRELLQRCLQKDPRRRLQAIGEARIALEETLSGTPEELASGDAGPVRPVVWRRAAPWAAGILLAIVVGLSVWELRPRPDAAQMVQFSLGPPAGDSLVFRFGATPLAISRDGTEVVFLVRHSGTLQLYLRRMDQLESAAVKGTDNADNPFFSPDGQWVGFFADGKLKKVSVLGGTPVTLCDASIGRGGTWAGDDSIIFAPTSTSGLMRVSAAGGAPLPFTRLDSTKGERSHRWPQVLPGSKAVLYASGSTFDSEIVVATLKTGNAKILPLRGGYPRYVTGGYLVFERPDGLFAVAFDLQRLEVTGSPFPVLQALASPVNGVAAVAVSETGSLVYVPAGATIGNLAWVDRKGVLEAVGAPARDYFPRIQLSPEGKRVVVVIQEGGSRDAWVYDIPRGALTRLTFGEGDNSSPVLSPDGQRIAFSRFKDGNNSLLTKPADGSGSEETLLPAQASLIFPTSWSPDGKFLAYSQPGRSGKLEIWVVPLEGEHKPQPLMANQFDEINAAFSPDGKYLAYASNESGHYEVYVIPFGLGSGKWQISTGGGNFPVWARNGKELFYRYRGDIMGVDINTQPVLKASAPRAIVPAKAIASLSNGLDNFDVSPDGQRFLIHQQSSEAGQTLQINVVLHWSEELRRLTPSGNQP